MLRSRKLNVAARTGVGTVIAAPGTGKQIVVVDILASAATTLKQTDGSGAIVAYIPAGSSNLSYGIPIGINVALHSTAGDITVTYYIEDQNAITP